MKSSALFLLFCGLLLGLGTAATVNGFKATPAEPVGQGALGAQLVTTATPPWGVQATGEAAATQAAAAFTQIAETTRQADERRLTATAARVATLEAYTSTVVAVTAAALQITAAFEQSAATRAASLTQAADALAAQRIADAATAEAAITQAAATRTQVYADLVATEAARREVANTNYATAAAGLAPLGQICWGLFIPLAGLFFGWYLLQLAQVDVERRRAESALLDTVWGPAQARFNVDGSLTINLLNPPGEAKAAIAQARQTALGVGKPPAVVAVRADNDAEDDLTRVCNLLAAAMRVEGNGGTKIPRYHSIGYHAEVRAKLVNLLVAAGHVRVKSNAGAESGTFLSGTLTLYELWSDLRVGRATLAPLPHTSAPL